MPLMVMGRLPQHFPEPDRFKPERWSTDAEDAPDVFASLSFGFGPRMCIGKLFCMKIPVEIEGGDKYDLNSAELIYTCLN